MAATMILGAINKDGLAQIKVRIQDRKSKTHIRMGTGLYINHTIWERRNDEKYLDRFVKNKDVMNTLEAASEIRRAIDAEYMADRRKRREEWRLEMKRRKQEEFELLSELTK